VVRSGGGKECCLQNGVLASKIDAYFQNLPAYPRPLPEIDCVQPAALKSASAGHGQPSARIESALTWPGVELLLEEQDIHTPSTWTIQGDDHAVIVHLSGRIRQVETQIDGVGSLVAPLGPGEISIVPAGHSYRCRAHGGIVTYGTLRIRSSAFREILGACGAAGELRVGLGQRDGFVYESVRRLAQLAGHTDDMSQMIGAGLIQALCGHLYQTYQTGMTDQAAERSAFTVATARLVQQYVQDHLAERITLEALGALAGLGVRELFVAFRKAFQTTPAQYVLEQRIRRARWLLTNTREDITAISLLTGFASHSHLTTTFKKHTGSTPSRFRSDQNR
jgi:AraC family transcriptional regulator